ncbi:MAG: DUF998 domain-containing protein [Anaerolineae bacterium]
MDNSKRIRFLWLLGVFAPLWLSAVSVVAGALTPGYSPVSEVVSELGARGMPYADLMNGAGFMLTGIFIILFSLGAKRMMGNGKLAGLTSLLIALTGVGVFGSGYFPCDPGCAIENMSIPMLKHALAGLTTFAFSAVTPLVVSFHYWRSRRWGYFAYSLLTGVALLSLLSIMFSPIISGIEGLHQRAFLGIYFLWVIFFALSIKPRQSHPQEQPA